MNGLHHPGSIGALPTVDIPGGVVFTLTSARLILHNAELHTNTMIPQATLKKIQSIKTLRDRAGTDGEKDAAQSRLTILLAKHKLTEQDIPDPNFSTRQRYHRPHSNPFDQQRRQDPHAGFNAEFEETLRKMREAAEAAQRSTRRNTGRAQSRQSRNPFGDPAWEPSTAREPRTARKSKGKLGNRERFEQALGAPVTDTTWKHVVRRAHRRATGLDQPSNKAAYARAFYESAAYRIRERMYPESTFSRIPSSRRCKSKNTQGIAAGALFADNVNLGWFPLNSEP